MKKKTSKYSKSIPTLKQQEFDTSLKESFNPPQPSKESQPLTGTELSIKDNILLTNFGDLNPGKWFKVPGVNNGVFIKSSDTSYFNAFDILAGTPRLFDDETQVLGIRKVNLYLN